MAFATTGAVAYLLAGIDGAATIVLDVLILTSLQRMLGNAVLGRVIGAVDSLVVGGMLLFVASDFWRRRLDRRRHLERPHRGDIA